MREFTCSSPEETESLGLRIGQLAKEGMVLALRGGLGSGKTVLTKGIARGLAVQEPITSPTYTILSEYSGRLPLYHMDAYRLQGDEEGEALGMDDYFYGKGLTVVEWSERISGAIPAKAAHIELVIIDAHTRVIQIKDPYLEEIL